MGEFKGQYRKQHISENYSPDKVFRNGRILKVADLRNVIADRQDLIA